MNLNYDNITKRLNNIQCDDGLTFEPRLQEYLKKKSLYKKNGITSCISLEQEFLITDIDIQNMKRFLSGKKDIYSKKNDTPDRKNNAHNTKNMFPSAEFRNSDKRQLNINNRIKNTTKEIVNRGMFVPDTDEKYYTHDTNHSYKLLDSRNLTDNLIPRSNDTPHHSRTYNVAPEIDYKDTFHYESRCHPEVSTVHTQHNKKHNHEVSQLIGTMDTYKRTPVNNVNELAELDTEYKVVIPKNSIKSKRDLNCLENQYQSIPFMGQSFDLRNTDIESDMIVGLPSRSFKTYGFRNPQEHYFDYISGEIQEPDHVVLPFERGGISTRLDNKSNIKKVQKREMY